MRIVEVNDKVEYIHDDYCLADLIRKELGDDIGDKVLSLVEELEDKRVDKLNELDEVELFADSLYVALADINNLVRDEMDILHDRSNRMDRKKILGSLHDIQNRVESVI